MWPGSSWTAWMGSRWQARGPSASKGRSSHQSCQNGTRHNGSTVAGPASVHVGEAPRAAASQPGPGAHTLITIGHATTDVRARRTAPRNPPQHDPRSLHCDQVAARWVSSGNHAIERVLPGDGRRRTVVSSLVSVSSKWERRAARAVGRHCCWSVSPGRSPNPPCVFPRNGLSRVAVGGLVQAEPPR